MSDPIEGVAELPPPPVFIAADRAAGFTMKLPRAGITLLPPWWIFLLWSDKRHENRAPSVAGRIQGWRGLFAFGASKVTGADKQEEIVMEARSVIGEPWFGWNANKPKPFPAKEMFARGGHIVGVSELLGTEPNGEDPKDKWAVPGEHSLLLGRVWEVEPVPCSGGRGMCAIGACKHCHHIGSIENKADPLVCRRCKKTTLRQELEHPSLRILAEYGRNGHPQPISLTETFIEAPHPSTTPSPET